MTNNFSDVSIFELTTESTGKCVSQIQNTFPWYAEPYLARKWPTRRFTENWSPGPMNTYRVWLDMRFVTQFESEKRPIVKVGDFSPKLTFLGVSKVFIGKVWVLSHFLQKWGFDPKSTKISSCGPPGGGAIVVLLGHSTLFVQTCWAYANPWHCPSISTHFVNLVVFCKLVGWCLHSCRLSGGLTSVPSKLW